MPRIITLLTDFGTADGYVGEMKGVLLSGAPDATIAPPAHGTLSGTAPNVTYTPATNYAGSDSFTFKANDGTADSAPATVSIFALWRLPGLPLNCA